jgi:hypothetical protein
MSEYTHIYNHYMYHTIMYMYYVRKIGVTSDGASEHPRLLVSTRNEWTARTLALLRGHYTSIVP